jgi:predicted mannosyl-3-phosphoglycerate phosphatase (HAD superfamily)
MQAYPYPDSYNYAKTHELLNREWFGDRDDIREVLDRADQDAWEKVLANRMLYPLDVQGAIGSYIVKPHKVRDISDKELKILQEKKKEQVQERFEKAWEECVKTLPGRTLSDVDTANDDAWTAVATAKASLAKYLATRKYVARGSTDVLLKTHEEKVKEAETEYARTSKEVELCDAKFRDSQKHKFYENWVCQL